MVDPDARISLQELPEVYEEIERLLDSPDRVKRVAKAGITRKTVERARREGLPKQMKLVLSDPGIARALLAAAERLAA